jgi:NAD(P)H-nitrite reductase large subunit
MRRLLIAGAGPACVACLEQLLKFSHQFRITVFEGPGPQGPENGPGRAAQSKSGDAEPNKDAVRDKIDPPRREWLRKNDVEVLTAVCVEAIDRHANVVRGCDGSRTTFDTLILAAGGSIPALARAAGLEVRSGVVVNDYMEASDAHVYALGEGAEHRGSIYTDTETVVEQARVLAAHLFGYNTAPFVPPAKAADLAPLLQATSSNQEWASQEWANQEWAVNASGALSDVSADSAPRWEDRKPEPVNRIALAGAA